MGAGAFTHEAGIHVDGLFKHAANYQSLDPALFGRGHRIVLGKHSGTSAVAHAYERLGIPLGEDDARRILGRVREFAVAHKRMPGFRDLMSFYLENRAPEHAAH